MYVDREMCLFMNKRSLRLFLSYWLIVIETWDLLAVKILLTGCLMGWLARTIVANFQANAKKAAARKKRVRRPRAAQHSQASQTSQASVSGH